MACLTAEDVKRVQQNKVEIYNWMSKANALICYYENGNRVCESGSGASVSQ